MPVGVEPGGAGDLVGSEDPAADLLVLHAQWPACRALPLVCPPADLVEAITKVGRPWPSDRDAKRRELISGDQPSQPCAQLLPRGLSHVRRGGPRDGHIRRWPAWARREAWRSGWLVRASRAWRG